MHHREGTYGVRSGLHASRSRSEFLSPIRSNAIGRERGFNSRLQGIVHVLEAALRVAEHPPDERHQNSSEALALHVPRPPTRQRLDLVYVFAVEDARTPKTPQPAEL